MNKNIRFLYLAILLFSIVSCSAEKSPGCEDNQECTRAVMDLSDVLIPKSQVSVYADISAYDLTNTIVQTKSSEETVNLESLLDRSKAVQYSFKSGVYYQIPFFQNEDDVLADVSEDESPDIASATRVKKFYMELTQDGTLYHYVVTMFTSAQYFKNNPNFDFRHKPNYSGVILFSTVQGKIFDVNYYHDGLVIDASILTREEIESGNYENLHYVKLYQSIPVTRSQTPIEIDGGEIEGSICVAEGNHGNQGNQGNNNDNDDWPDDTIIPDFGGGGGGSGAPSQGSGSGGGRNNKTPLLNEPSYSINLSTNEPEEYSVQGSGVYVDGTLISISCTFIGVIPGYLPFSRWIGDFKQYSTPYFQHVVSEDIVSTAIFGYGGPCHDKARGVTNPAKQMSIAATSSGSYYGGTFGMTRNGGTK